MGGSVAKTMGKIVDPFNLSPKISKSWVGKSMRAINKVVDPLNIMDPVGVLPTSWAAGKKPHTFDTTYGGAAQKWLGINQKAPYIPPKYDFSKLPKANDNSQMMSNLLAQQKTIAAQSIANNESNLAAKNAAQQANINSILDQSKQTNFSSPNLNGLTFGGE
jgi:hypothetical protein